MQMAIAKIVLVSPLLLFVALLCLVTFSAAAVDGGIYEYYYNETPGGNGSFGGGNGTLHNYTVSGTGSYSVNVSGLGTNACGTLSTAGETYTMTANIVNNSLTGPCINITAQNITLDCAGYYISSDDSQTGIYSNQINTTIKNCNISMGSGSGGYGIKLVGADDSYVFNNTLNWQYYGLYLYDSSNVTISNNTANSNIYGIYLYNQSSNNILTNITANSNIYGIRLESSSNNTITGNTANSNSATGIVLLSSSNNTITGNTANSNVLYGIYLKSLSSNNNLTNNNIWDCSLVGDNGCIYVIANNNIFNNNKINKSSEYGIIVDGDNNLFKNTNMTNIDGTSVSIYTNEINNTFLNFSYNNESVASGGELIRKWYYQAYVNDTAGNNVTNANVTAYNVSGTYNFNLTTDTTGYTSLGEIIDYVNTGTRTYYSNYTIYATNSSYLTGSHTYNVTSNENNYKDVFTLTSNVVSECTILDSPGNYVMNQSITNNSLTGPCINITAQNITLDCAGYYISSDDSQTGIYSNQINTTIKNCNISMGSGSGGYGIKLVGADDSYVFNNTLNEQYLGLSVLSDYVLIENNIANHNALYGIAISTQNSIVRNNTLNYNDCGMYMGGVIIS